MIKMLEDRLATKDNELRERSNEYDKIYELHKRTTKQHADTNAKLRQDYSLLKSNLVEHVQACAEYMKYSTVILHHKTEDFEQFKQRILEIQETYIKEKPSLYTNDDLECELQHDNDFTVSPPNETDFSRTITLPNELP